jgi:hypothetical protein
MEGDVNDPQPIKTAPKDGTPILSNLGVIFWVKLESGNGFWLFQDHETEWGLVPTLWVPVPDWMKSE